MNKVSNYFKESYHELLEKVSWPTWSQLQQSTVIVLVATLLITAIVWVMDLLAQGGLALLSTLSESLRQEAAIQIPVLEQAVAQSDHTTASAAAHRIKGAAWSLGLRSLASACLGLEHAVAGGMADTTRLCHEVVKAYERGQAALDAIVKGRN